MSDTEDNKVNCEHLSIIEKSVYLDGQPVRGQFCTKCDAEVKDVDFTAADANKHKISIQYKDTEDGMLFVGSCTEFPDLFAFDKTATECYESMLDFIGGLIEPDKD